MLYLLSISVTLVGTATLLALILFSSRIDDTNGGERLEGEEEKRVEEYLPPTRARGDGVRNESRGGADTGGKGPPSATERQSARGSEAGSPRSDVQANTGGDEGGTRTQDSISLSAEPAKSIPILRPETLIPGLGKFELVHFLGKAGFGTLEDQRELQEIHIEGSGPQLELQGDVAITSRHIIVFDAKTTKKIPFGVVEAYRFHDSFLLLKKRNVKTKKTLLKIFGNIATFKYILCALIPL